MEETALMQGWKFTVMITLWGANRQEFERTTRGEVSRCDKMISLAK